MRKKMCIWAVAIAGFTSSVRILPAQSDAWLMKNYRFTGPPAPRSIQPVDPVMSELQRVQSATLWIMRQAKSDGDYPTALAAATQAAVNAEAIAAITERRIALATQAREIAEESKASVQPALYFIAFRDHTVATATQYWVDRWLLHYMTQQGSHVQVRMDLVDRELSVRLNRELNQEFRLPE